ncbi:diaminopropionate ammonia-lyase, partial [Salmonella enterica subsp. enterica serovar Enteritidis str. 13183-1]
ANCVKSWNRWCNNASQSDGVELVRPVACGEPNIISWPIIRDNTSCFISADDCLAAKGMRISAAPRPGTDTPFISGESG